MSKPQFTIAIPAYKSYFLRKAIESVLNQTLVDYELIILNDCSPEPIDDIIGLYKDERIRYYKNNSNVGILNLVDNWNRCLELARGDYFLCMGDDDELLPSCLEQYSRIIRKYPELNVYHGQTLIIDEHNNPICVPFSRPEWESAYELIYFRILGRKQFIGDFVYRTSFLKENNGFYKLPAAWGTDDITAVLAATDKGIANTHEVVFLYRSNPFSISSSGDIKIKLNAIKQEENWYRDYLTCGDSGKNDNIYKQMIIKEFRKSFQKKRLRIIADDLMLHPFNLFKWLISAAYYDLSRPMICYAMIMSIRDRKSIIYQRNEKE